MKRPPISKYHSLKMFLKQSRKSVKQVGFNSIGNPGYRLFYRPCQFRWLASETFLMNKLVPGKPCANVPVPVYQLGIPPIVMQGL